MTMSLQSAVVALLVPACALYAAWLLAPVALKRAAARGLLRWPLPAPIANALRRTADGAAGCGCDGCDAPPKAAPPAEAPITLHRRR
jgi:hypothetical protein